MTKTRITSDLEPDDYQVLSASYRMDREDRQRIDSQIVGTQEHLAASLLRGQLATYCKMAVDGNAGDVVCAYATPATEADPTTDVRVATVATTAALASGVTP